MNELAKKLFNFFVFSNLFIAMGAWAMTLHTLQLFGITDHNTNLSAFVFFSTLASYNLHWLLTDPTTERTRPRWKWLAENKNTHLYLFFIALVPAVFYLFQIWQHWPILAPLFLFTFIYTAPKLPVRYFQFFGQYNIGKTFVLTAVWVYATTVLPLLAHLGHWTLEFSFFCLYRFGLIFAICILFDLKDRRHDRSNGIKSIVTWLPTQKLKIIFTIFLALAFAAALVQFFLTRNGIEYTFSLIPIVLTYRLFQKSLLSTNSFFYYFTLDGIMALPSLLHFFFIFAGLITV